MRGGGLPASARETSHTARSRGDLDPFVWSGRVLQEGCRLGWWCCGLASMMGWTALLSTVAIDRVIDSRRGLGGGDDGEGHWLRAAPQHEQTTVAGTVLPLLPHAPCPAIWPLRLPKDCGLAARCRLACERQAGRADLAARGTEGPPKAAQTRPPVADRRLMHPLATTASQSRVVVRLR